MTVVLKDEAATAALGARIAQGLGPGDVVLLSGDLGAGKTALARFVLRELGVGEHVPSPTFTLVQAYETPRLTVHHFDLYRIESSRDLEELGLEDAADNGAILVEWPERAGDRFPDESLRIELRVTSPTAREAYIVGPQRWRRALAHA